MYGGRKLNYVMIFLGLLSFIAASILLHAFSGKFGQDTAGVSSIESSMPVMEDTINVTGQTSDTQQLSAASPGAGSAVIQDWVVYVTGSVKKPGVYKVPGNSRVYQALGIAGGFTDKADQEAVNLAAMLEDGVHIHFPARGEPNKIQNPAVSAPSTAQNSNVQVKKTAVSKLLDINTAEQATLEELPGIGPKTAQSIIQYRDANGGFQRIEDLLLIKGIGPKKYDAIKSLVSVGR